MPKSAVQVEHNHDLGPYTADQLLTFFREGKIIFTRLLLEIAVEDLKEESEINHFVTGFFDRVPYLDNNSVSGMGKKLLGFLDDFLKSKIIDKNNAKIWKTAIRRAVRNSDHY